MNRDEERRNGLAYDQRKPWARWRLREKLIVRRDLANAVRTRERDRQPLDVMIVVLVINSGARPRSMMRLEMAMDEIRVISVVIPRDVDVLRRQHSECKDGQYSEHSDERLSDAA
jgi:hypothetical protein